MYPPLPILGADLKESTAWLNALADVLPDERLVLPSQLTLAERACVDVAIVANPEPAQLEGFTHLKWVQSVWAGVERLLAASASHQFDVVKMVDSGLSHAMAEAVVAWSLYLHRDMPAYHQQQAQKVWQPQPYRRASDTTIGILGLGELGSYAAKMLAPFGFRLVGWRRDPKDVPHVDVLTGDIGLIRLAEEADIIVCLLPLTSQTTGLLNRSFFAAMKPQSCLINFARGPIVVEEDLLSALDSSQLGHAVLDVFTMEPLPADSRFWEHEKVTVLPHISGPTDMQSALSVVQQNIQRYRQTNSIPAAVQRDRGY